MLLYTGFKANETAKKTFFALQVDDFPTIEALVKESGVSRHGVREALNRFRGAGLVWGDGCHGLSDDGQRLLELLPCGRTWPRFDLGTDRHVALSRGKDLLASLLRLTLGHRNWGR